MASKVQRLVIATGLVAVMLACKVLCDDRINDIGVHHILFVSVVTVSLLRGALVAAVVGLLVASAASILYLSPDMGPTSSSTVLKSVAILSVEALSAAAFMWVLLRSYISIQESETRFRSMADSSPALIWLTDENNKAQYFNVTWQKFTGRTLSQSLEHSWLDDIHPEDRERVRSVMERAMNEKRAFTVEFRLKRADGEYRSMLDTGQPRYKRGGTWYRGFIGSCVDIQHLKNAQRIVDLEARRKTIFLNAMSHDLRTPLNAAMLATHNVTTILDNIVDAKALGGDDYTCAVDDLKAINNCIRSAGDLLDQFLELSRLSGKQDDNQLEEVDLSELLLDVMGRLRPIAESKNLRLTLTGDTRKRITTDRIKLQRVVQNLVDNGLKFTRHGGVRVEVGEEAGSVVVRVKDSGVGIAEQDVEMLFGEFFQGQNNARNKRKGFGLGLFIARSLAQQIGGDLVLESTGNNGSCFRLCFTERLSTLNPSASGHEAQVASC